MAAGLITVAHDSGGPKADIVVEWNGGRTGYLGSDVETYVKALLDIAALTDSQRDGVRTRARASVSRFTDEVFDGHFSDFLKPLLRKWIVRWLIPWFLHLFLFEYSCNILLPVYTSGQDYLDAERGNCLMNTH